MAVHKLILDDVFDEVCFSLLAMHCTIEDYRLAYLLNSHLGIKLKRHHSNLDFDKGNSSFSIFEWHDKKQLVTWYLVSNICKQETILESNNKSLFYTQQKITKTYHLLPEYKTVNYYLKIDGEFNQSKEKYILNTILKIPQIATAYSIDANQLKSKDNLIFS